MITVGTNSYVTAAELVAYANARDIRLDGDAEVLLVKAMDWLEAQPFKGLRVDSGQALCWPRQGVLFEENEVSGVPDAIKAAQFEAAMLIDSGADLFAPVTPKVTREKVDVVEVEYAEGGGSTTYYPKLSRLISSYVNASGIGSLNVRRG